MNGWTNCIEVAAEKTGRVTAKHLRALIRSGDGSLGLHGTATYNRPSYSDSFEFEVTSKRKDRKSGAEIRSSLTVPGAVRNGNTSKRETRTHGGRSYLAYCEAFRPAKGFWYLSYHGERIAQILDLLPSDAEVAFEVYMDAGTNQNLVDAEMHADHLYLKATYRLRGKRHDVEFLIDTSAGKHNTARFGVLSYFD